MVSSFALLILATTIAAPSPQKISCPVGASFSGDGKWFQDNNQKLYEVATGKPAAWQQPEGTVAASKPWNDAIRFHGTVAINFDGSTVAYARGYGMGELSKRVTYSEKGKGSLTEIGSPFGFSFSDDGHWMATRCRPVRSTDKVRIRVKHTINVPGFHACLTPTRATLPLCEVTHLESTL